VLIKHKNRIQSIHSVQRKFSAVWNWNKLKASKCHSAAPA